MNFTSHVHLSQVLSHFIASSIPTTTEIKASLFYNNSTNFSLSTNWNIHQNVNYLTSYDLILFVIMCILQKNPDSMKCKYVVNFTLRLLENKRNDTVYLKHFSSRSDICSNGRCSISLSLLISNESYTLILLADSMFYRSVTPTIPAMVFGKHAAITLVSYALTLIFSPLPTKLNSYSYSAACD